jgi:hypothetical protein
MDNTSHKGQKYCFIYIVTSKSIHSLFLPIFIKCTYYESYDSISVDRKGCEKCASPQVDILVTDCVALHPSFN